MTTLLRPAVVLFVLLSVFTGALYPIAVTGIGQALFARQANGSVIVQDGKPVGSSLIGQDFSGEARYFWGRLSATSPAPYTAFNSEKVAGSSGSNLGPTNPALTDAVKARIEMLKAADAAAGYVRPAEQRVPIDLVTSSGSGLDPHITLAAAEYQLPRVAKALNLPESQVRALVEFHTERRQLGILGEPVVNFLGLNLALDDAAR